MAAVISPLTMQNYLWKKCNFCKYIYSGHSVALHIYGAQHDEAQVERWGEQIRVAYVSITSFFFFLHWEALKILSSIQADIVTLLPVCCPYPPAILSPSLLRLSFTGTEL